MSKQRMGHKPVEEFIKFQFSHKTASGLTSVWSVVNVDPKTGNGYDHIGIVRWHGAWRKYVYESPPNSIYDWECLRLIANFIEEQTVMHRERLKDGNRDS